MAWTLMKEGGEAENFGAAHKEFMIDSISDLENEPTEYGSIAPGSFAYTAGYDAIFQKNSINEWVEASEGGEGPSTVTWSNVTGKPFTSDVDGNVTATGNMKIHYNGQEINVGQAITSGGGGGGLSTMTITMTEEQIMSFLFDAEVELNAEQFEDFNPSNPPDVLFLYGEMPGANMSLSLNKVSDTNLGVHDIGYGGASTMTAMGENNMVYSLNVVFDSDNVFSQAYGTFKINISLNPASEIETGSVPTYTDDGAIEWIPPSGEESDLMLEMTSEQMAAYASDYKFTFTEEQLAEFDFSNPPSKLVFHGSTGSMEMDVIMRLVAIENVMGHRLKYGAICGQGDSSIITYAVSFISEIKFDSNAEEAVEGWLAEKFIVADPQVPSEDGTYVLQAVRNGIYETLSWVLKE